MINTQNRYLKIIVFFLGLSLIFFINEYFIYYAVLYQCRWPELDVHKRDTNISTKNIEYEPVKVMILADTHLLGSREGHWFDKLRREWQMYRAFQTALTLHEPQVVFVLGDLLDEGQSCSKAEFQYYVDRFYSLFAVPYNTELYVVAGNHDMGFHYGISPYLNERFVTAFAAPTVRLLTIRGNHFVLINSMALEGDGCFLCRPAERQLDNIKKALKCVQGSTTTCEKTNQRIEVYSRPIILQHYPLHRESDAKRCDPTDPDLAPEPELSAVHAEGRECLSKGATWDLLNNLLPRLAVGGHTHHGCYRRHQIKDKITAEEISVPSFSWRNKKNPSFLLAVFTPDNFAVGKCHMPREQIVQAMWVVGVIALTVYCVFFVSTRRVHKYKV